MSRTFRIQAALAPVPEEQVRHLLLAFFLSQTLQLGPSSLSLFSLALSLRLTRGPPPVLLQSSSSPALLHINDQPCEAEAASAT